MTAGLETPWHRRKSKSTVMVLRYRGAEHARQGKDSIARARVVACWRRRGPVSAYQNTIHVKMREYFMQCLIPPLENVGPYHVCDGRCVLDSRNCLYRADTLRSAPFPSLWHMYRKKQSDVPLACRLSSRCSEPKAQLTSATQHMGATGLG